MFKYADALIRLLKVLKHKSKYLEGEVDRPVLTAINSLRVANYVSKPFGTAYGLLYRHTDWYVGIDL